MTGMNEKPCCTATEVMVVVFLGFSDPYCEGTLRYGKDLCGDLNYTGKGTVKFASQFFFYRSWCVFELRYAVFASFDH